MAKKGNEAEGSAAKTLRDLLNKELKGQVFHIGTDALQADVTGHVSTRLTLLDADLGGGVPLGRTVEVYGAASCGKTTLALHLLASCQAAGGVAVYIDVEKTFSKELATKLGVDLDRLLIMDQMVMLEDVFTYIRKTIPAVREAFEGCPILFVWDTLAATPTVGAVTGKGQTGAPYRARVIREELAAVTQLLSETNITLIFINHVHQVIDKRVGWGAGPIMVTSGGEGPKYHASVRLMMRIKGQIRDAQKRVIGQEVVLRVEKNKLGPPRSEIGCRLYFGLGFVDEWSIFDYLREKGVVEQPANSTKLQLPMPDGTILKIYPSKYLETLRDNEGLLQHLRELAKEHYNSEIPSFQSVFSLIDEEQPELDE